MIIFDGKLFENKSKQKMSSSEEETEESGYIIVEYDFKTHSKELRDLDELVFHDDEDEPYPASVWRRFKGYLYKRNGTIIGYLMYQRVSELKSQNMYTTDEGSFSRKPDIQIELVGVHPQYQGTGIGGTLMRHIIQKEPFASMTLAVDAKKPQNIRFYNKYGFSVLGALSTQEELLLMYRPNKTVPSTGCMACGNIEAELEERETRIRFCSNSCLQSFIDTTISRHTHRP